MKQNKERAISIISGEYYEDVLSTLPVTIANNSHVKACCGSDLVDCFENVNAEYLMSEGQIRTGEECHIKEMQLKKFN